MKHEVPLSEISNDLGLSDRNLHQLQDIGILSAEDLLGLIYAAFKEVVQELKISPGQLSELKETLRRHIDPYKLRQIEDIQRSISSLPTGAEIGPAPHRELTPDYDYEEE